jgi:hypothetical protein
MTEARRRTARASAPRRLVAQTLASTTRSYPATVPIAQSQQPRSRFALSLDSLAFSLAAASSPAVSAALPGQRYDGEIVSASAQIECQVALASSRALRIH